jgi:hypothetical protein
MISWCFPLAFFARTNIPRLETNCELLNKARVGFQPFADVLLTLRAAVQEGSAN